MALTEEFDAESLRAWQKDPRGQIFWEKCREMFTDAVSQIRHYSRNGDVGNTSYHSGWSDCIEEVIQLPDLIIQEQKSNKEAQDGKNA